MTLTSATSSTANTTSNSVSPKRCIEGGSSASKRKHAELDHASAGSERMTTENVVPPAAKRAHVRTSSNATDTSSVSSSETRSTPTTSTTSTRAAATLTESSVTTTGDTNVALTTVPATYLLSTNLLLSSNPSATTITHANAADTTSATAVSNGTILTDHTTSSTSSNVTCVSTLDGLCDASATSNTAQDTTHHTTTQTSVTNTASPIRQQGIRRQRRPSSLRAAGDATHGVASNVFMPAPEGGPLTPLTPRAPTFTTSGLPSTTAGHTVDPYLPQTITEAAEERWHDVDRNVRRMDELFDASFYPWLRNEANVWMSAGYLQRLATEYPVERTARALAWLANGWSVHATAVLARVVTLHWCLAAGADVAVAMQSEEMSNGSRGVASNRDGEATPDNEDWTKTMMATVDAGSESSTSTMMRSTASMPAATEVGNERSMAASREASSSMAATTTVTSTNDAVHHTHVSSVNNCCYCSNMNGLRRSRRPRRRPAPIRVVTMTPHTILNQAPSALQYSHSAPTTPITSLNPAHSSAIRAMPHPLVTNKSMNFAPSPTSVSALTCSPRLRSVAKIVRAMTQQYSAADIGRLITTAYGDLDADRLQALVELIGVGWPVDDFVVMVHHLGAPVPQHVRTALLDRVLCTLSAAHVHHTFLQTVTPAPMSPLCLNHVGTNPTCCPLVLPNRHTTSGTMLPIAEHSFPNGAYMNDQVRRA